MSEAPSQQGSGGGGRGRGGSGGGGGGRGKGGNSGGRGRGKGRGGGGAGRGRGGGGGGGSGAGPKDNSSESGDGGNKGSSKNASATPAGNNNNNSKGPKGGRGGKDGGSEGRGNKNRRRNNNNKSKGTENVGPVEPQISAEEKQRIEEERKQAEAAEAERKRLEEEHKAAEAAREARRMAKGELENQVREACNHLKSVIENTISHKQSRDTLQPEALANARKSFEANKKTLKSDLKKSTAFVKKIKSGGISSMKPADITRDISTLNLSRYVEEVVSSLLEAKLKLTDIPVVLALCTAMHQRYPEFLGALVPKIWSVIHGKPANEEASKLRRIYVRLITEFLLTGLQTETKGLLKLIAETTGGKDGNYVVTDANVVVAFAKAASFEIFGITPQSVRTACSLIRKEVERLEEHEKEIPETVDSLSGEGAALIPKEEAVVISAQMAEDGLASVQQMEQLLAERAVPFEISQTFVNHCKGAFGTLSNSLVATHGKLQKLEKRCEQDRLLSGSLTDVREKGLIDARRLLESLLKSVEVLSDVLDEPMPQLEVEEKETSEGGGVGVELWTKGDEEGAGDFGPFDDEETYAFYCDIPDFLTTVPPALLGMSSEEIEKRKAENLARFGSGFESLPDDGENEPAEVEASSEAQLEAAEKEEAMGASKEGERTDEGKLVFEDIALFH